MLDPVMSLTITSIVSAMSNSFSQRLCDRDDGQLTDRQHATTAATLVIRAGPRLHASDSFYLLMNGSSLPLETSEAMKVRIRFRIEADGKLSLKAEQESATSLGNWISRPV